MTPHDTILSVEPGKDPIYGAWPNQQIMGIHPCTRTATKAKDGDVRFVDALGCAGAFRRGGLAIHVSGKDIFGHDDYIPGRIRAMAVFRIDWPPYAFNRPSGLGCHEPQPAVIVSADHDERVWGHHAHYSDTRSFWTLEGIWKATFRAESFTPQDLCELHALAYPNAYTKYGKIQERAARRIIEFVLGTRNTDIAGRPVLERVGRWAYRWREAAK